MAYLKKLCILVLALLMLNLYIPRLSLAQEYLTSLKVPKHEPQSWSIPEQDIPTVKVKKTSGWTWLLLIALIGGAAAAAGGGGEESSSGSTSGATGRYIGSR